MSRAIRRSLQVLVLAGLVGAFTACGGSSSKSGNPSATTTTSASSGPSTTTAGAATLPAGDPTAAKAALQLSDVGAGFANYRKADGVKAFDKESCAVMAPGAFLTTRDHVYSGPMFKKKDSTYFAYSEGYAFRTEALAKRFATFRSTSAFKQCKVKQDDAATRAARASVYVKLTPISWSDPSGNVPSMYRELTGSTSAGKQVDNGFYDRYTLLHGRVVVVVNIDSDLGRDTAASQAIANQTGDILRSLDAALAKRLAGI